MDDNKADSEPMEDSSSSEKIDLSLDDIIKLNKKEQRAAPGGSWRKNTQAASRNDRFKKFNRTGHQQNFRFKRGSYKFPQGPNRFWSVGPATRGFYRSRPYSLRRGTLGMKGVSPLNRPPWSRKNVEPFGPLRSRFGKPFYQPYRGPPGALKRIPFGQKIAHSQQSQRRGRGRPFVLNRGFFALNASNKLEKYQKDRSWRMAPSSGSILTVSLDNSNSAPEPQAKHPAESDRFLEDGGGVSLQPKGIPLRFNFKAVSNQTGLTLNDRFTELKIRGNPRRGSWRGRGGRMVSMQ